MKGQPATDLRQAIQQALKEYHQPQVDDSPFVGLQIFEQVLREDDSSVQRATNKILLDLLTQLAVSSPPKAELLTRRFLDGETMQAIALSLNVSPAGAYRWQNEAIDRLASILQDEESRARRRWRAVQEKRLERPTYSRLIGVETHLRRLLEILDRREPPWVISIEGLGGGGKTSLADALVRRIIEQGLFDETAWVSARQHIFKLSGQIQPARRQPALTVEELVDKLLAQLLPSLPRPESPDDQKAYHRLKTQLKQRHHLVVIDNLETFRDVEALLPALHDLANPSKFLLTSRDSLYHDLAIYSFPLPELSETDALELIRSEAKKHNLTSLYRAAAEDLQKIYQVVGGNPLAVRLVIGQAHIFTLAAILDDLRQVHSRPIEELYTFIYERAWQALDEPTRELFLVMPLLTDAGEPLEALVELSDLDPAVVRPSLKRLSDLNLINISGDHTNRYYSIHNLTRTFLQDHVLKWK